MKKQTQQQLIKETLLDRGFISRNWCLQNFISRLSAIIYNLKEEGMRIEGRNEKTEYGRDFVYYLVQDTLF